MWMRKSPATEKPGKRLSPKSVPSALSRRGEHVDGVVRGVAPVAGPLGPAPSGANSPIASATEVDRLVHDVGRQLPAPRRPRPARRRVMPPLHTWFQLCRAHRPPLRLR